MSQGIADVTELTFSNEVERAKTPVLIDFWAPWCGPCRALTPMVESLASFYADRIKVVKVNIDENPEIAKRFAVRAIPLLVLTKAGQEIERASDSPLTRTRLSLMLDRHCD